MTNLSGAPLAAQVQGTPDVRAIQEFAEKAGLVVHHFPDHYIAVLEDMWPNGGETTLIGERKPFMQMFPDTVRGYQAMYSALERRFPELATPIVQCTVCGQSKPYAEFDTRLHGKNMRKLCRECRESEQHATKEREERGKVAFESARSDYISRFPSHEYQLQAAYTLAQLRAIAKPLENEQQAAVEWRNYCVTLGFTKHDMLHILRIHSTLAHRSFHKEQWKEKRERFLALTPPYYGTLGHTKARPLSRDETALLYDSQEGRCAYCNVKLLPLSYRKFRSTMVRAKDLPDWDGQGNEMELISIDADRMAQIEHRVPIARGGNDDKSNLVLACRACNLRKYVRTDEEFALLPNDAISQLGTSPQEMLTAIEYERRGYARFADEADYARSPVFHRVINGNS